MTDLSHLLLLVGWQLGESTESVERSLASSNRLEEQVRRGYGLSIVNVFSKLGLAACAWSSGSPKANPSFR